MDNGSKQAINFQELLDRQDDKWVEEYDATIERLQLNILHACELSETGSMMMVVEALQRVLVDVLARACPQYRRGWDQWLARALPYMVRGRQEGMPDLHRR
jgi:hypothetical protein